MTNRRYRTPQYLRIYRVFSADASAGDAPPSIPGDGAAGVGPTSGCVETSYRRWFEAELTSPTKKKLGWGRSLKTQHAPVPKKEEKEEEEEEKKEKVKEEEEEKPPSRPPSAPPVVIEKKAMVKEEVTPSIDDKELKSSKAENRLKRPNRACRADGSCGRNRR